MQTIYRKAPIADKEIGTLKTVIGYEDAAKVVGVSKATLMAAVLEGTGPKPVGFVQTNTPGRPPLAFLRKDLVEYRTVRKGQTTAATTSKLDDEAAKAAAKREARAARKVLTAVRRAEQAMANLEAAKAELDSVSA